MKPSTYRCTECGEITHKDDLLDAPNLFYPGDNISGCPECKAIERFELLCYEGNCENRVECGFPTDNGYKRTCGDHYKP